MVLISSLIKICFKPDSVLGVWDTKWKSYPICALKKVCGPVGERTKEKCELGAWTSVKIMEKIFK